MLEDLEEPRDIKSYSVKLLRRNEGLAKATIKQSS